MLAQEGAHTVNQTASRDVYKYSFFPRTIRDWNSLLEQVKGVNSIDGFKEQLTYTIAAPRYPY